MNELPSKWSLRGDPKRLLSKFESAGLVFEVIGEIALAGSDTMRVLSADHSSGVSVVITVLSHLPARRRHVKTERTRFLGIVVTSQHGTTAHATVSDAVSGFYLHAAGLL